jgi:hypothetical protein
MNRWLPMAVLALLAGFVGCEAAAMCAYPGGTFWDKTTVGYSFWQNFFCDLEWNPALNGQPNALAARLAQIAMLFVAAALAAFWWIVPRLFFRGAATVIRVLGPLSSLGLAVVSLMPSDRFGVLHGIAVIVTALPGLGAALLSVWSLATGEPRPRVAAALGASALAVAFVNFVLYTKNLVFHLEGTWVVAAVQKVAAMLLVAWMTVTALRVRRARRT